MRPFSFCLHVWVELISSFKSTDSIPPYNCKECFSARISLFLQQSTSYPAYCKELQRTAKSDANQARRQRETTCTNVFFDKVL